MKLASPTIVRLASAQKSELEEIARFTGVDVSKLLRLAVRDGLPRIKRQFGYAPKK